MSWISKKDKLPKMFKRVMVVVKPNLLTSRVDYDCVVYNPQVNADGTVSKLKKWETYGHKVTHWMYIPKLP